MQTVEIRVGEHIDEHWSEWFSGFKIVYTEGDETILIGDVEDKAALYGLIAKLQGDETILIGDVEDKAALYGLIAKLRDLGVSLIAVNFQETSTLSEES